MWNGGFAETHSGRLAGEVRDRGLIRALPTTWTEACGFRRKGQHGVPAQTPCPSGRARRSPQSRTLAGQPSPLWLANRSTWILLPVADQPTS